MHTDLRRWITLLETAPQTVRVYHGSAQPRLVLRNGPLYGVQDYGFAASYALNREGDGQHGFVHAFDFQFRKLATDMVVDALAEEYGLSLEDHPVSLVDSEHGHARMLLRKLIEQGYDGIHGFDFGFRADFEEIPTWVVFNAVRQATHIESYPVDRRDIERSARP